MKIKILTILLFIIVINISAFAVKQEKECLFYTIPTEEKSYIKLYREILDENENILLTSDFLFYIEHLFVDYSLRYTENNYLIDYYKKMLIALIDKVQKLYVDTDNKKIMHSKDKILEYLYVSLTLLEPKTNIPLKYKNTVMGEIEYINKHNKEYTSKIFPKMEDYTQYKPRGHYTDNTRMQNYFKSMMYFQRMRFPIYTNTEDPYLFTRAILMLNNAMKHKDINELYNKLYSIISFYLAQSDDLLIIEMDKMFNAPINDKTLMDKILLEQFIDTVKKYDKSKILSDIKEDNSKKDIVIGLMGQRYLLDSEIFTNLVYNKIGPYKGDKNKKPFSLIGNIRGFPRGLDFMYILGNNKSYEIMKQSGDIDYIGYDKMIQKLKQKVNDIDDNNMYERIIKQYISVINMQRQWDIMKCEKWQYKELNMLLASWAMLRHDVILYAKQSYTLKVTSKPIPINSKKRIIAEPYIELYKLIKQDIDYLSNQLYEFSGDSLYVILNNEIAGLIDIYIKIAELTLNNKFYNEHKTIISILNNIDRQLKEFIKYKKEKEDNTVMIADVHTEPNSKQVLEQATGFLYKIILNLYDVEFTGAIIPYYEFKQDMNNRLNDKEWENILKNNRNTYFDTWQEYLFENISR